MAENPIEARLSQLLVELERAAQGDQNPRWAVARALIHRAVHYATEGPGVDFCALATYLGEMIAHAHKLAHGDNPKAPAHKDFVH